MQLTLLANDLIMCTVSIIHVCPVSLGYGYKHCLGEEICYSCGQTVTRVGKWTAVNESLAVVLVRATHLITCVTEGKSANATPTTPLWQ